MGLVVAAGVEGEFSEFLAGCGVDDADVFVVGEEHDRGAGVGASDADVVEATLVADRDRVLMLGFRVCWWRR